MRTLLFLWLVVALHVQAAQPPVDPASDAPEQRVSIVATEPEPASHALALKAWTTPEQVNAWIARHFEYDMARALRLSETQRTANGQLPIHAPADFFARPQGVCVDLARFAVETLQVVSPQSRAQYLMIEFDPVAIQGNTLRRHWVAFFERDGQLYFFADSKRPGHIAGPYASTQAFVAEYAQYRQRNIVASRVLPTYQRRMKTRESRQPGAAG